MKKQILLSLAAVLSASQVFAQSIEAIRAGSAEFSFAAQVLPAPVRASVQFVSGRRVTVELPQGGIQFTCVIPDHGSRCSRVPAVFRTTAQGVTALRLSANGRTSEVPYQASGASVSLSFERQPYGPLVLREGPNTVAVELLQNGRSLGSENVRLFVDRTEWDF